MGKILYTLIIFGWLSLTQISSSRGKNLFKKSLGALRWSIIFAAMRFPVKSMPSLEQNKFKKFDIQL